LERLDSLIGWNNVVDGSKGSFREGNFQPEITDHSEGLRARHLMNQVGSNKKLDGAVRKFSDGMPIPNFLEKSLTHNELK
jgi:hypothetical protein